MEIDGVVETISTLVAGGQSIHGAMRMLEMMQVPSDVRERAAGVYAERVGSIVELRDPISIVRDPDEQWYAGPQPNHTFWPVLRTALEQNLPGPVVENVEGSASRVVSLLRPPGTHEIRTRGLVLGHVQSGKTTSFQAVAALAADAGYRMIIVLSGITENLRVQTQARVDEQLIGGQTDKWYRLTDETSDFHETRNAASVMSSSEHRLIAVVKKNPSRLARLAAWIKEAGEAAQLSCPILVIDDEADQASIDVGRQRRSRINALIREILSAPKAAYVAYTATPFANLLINPADVEDLYPRDFVVALTAGEDYYGPERLFGRDLIEHVEGEVVDPDDVIREVSEAEAKEILPPKGEGELETWQPKIDGSLREAIDWFLLATAARRARGHDEAHSSMLVHTTMLSDAHFVMQREISGYCSELRGDIAAGRPETLGRLVQQWAKESDRVVRKGDEPEVAWEELLRQLPSVLDSLDIIVDNYRSADRLVYVKGEPRTCIAIGGNTLSRGLTLEGLISSYFVRAASAYDTLLQMGRWFGYRRGYSDLVRIWMTAELAGWFKDLATVEAEIRAEIERYELEGLKPSELPVKIRTHASMSVTNAAKMKGAVQATVSYSGAREQTILFDHRDRESLSASWTAGAALVDGAAQAPGVDRVDGGPGKQVFRDVPARLVLDFLAGYKFNAGSRRLRPDLIRKYIELEMANGELGAWNVVVSGNGKGRRERLGGLEVGLGARSQMKSSLPGTANIKALVGSSDRGLDLAPEMLEALPENAKDKDLVKFRKERGLGPLLVLYPLDDRAGAGDSTARKAMNAVHPLLGVALYFPVSTAGSTSVDYVAAAVGEVEVERVEEELAAIDAAEEQQARAEEAVAQA